MTVLVARQCGVWFFGCGTRFGHQPVRHEPRHRKKRSREPADFCSRPGRNGKRCNNNEPVSYWCLVRFGLLLALAGTGWVMTSSALITLLAPVPIHTPMDFIRHVVLSPTSYPV